MRRDEANGKTSGVRRETIREDRPEKRGEGTSDGRRGDERRDKNASSCPFHVAVSYLRY